MRSKEPHGSEVQAAFAEMVEDERKPTSHAGGLDAIVGLSFGELEHAGAIGEEGGEAGGEIEAAGALLGEACDEGDGGGALGSSQPRHCLIGCSALVPERGAKDR